MIFLQLFISVFCVAFNFKKFSPFISFQKTNEIFTFTNGNKKTFLLLTANDEEKRREERKNYFI